jgi:hypothetical protein
MLTDTNFVVLACSCGTLLVCVSLLVHLDAGVGSTARQVRGANFNLPLAQSRDDVV